ncbi:MAG: hypothetical protein ABIT04_11260 [Novosphingobium sp.]
MRTLTLLTVSAMAFAATAPAFAQQDPMMHDGMRSGAMAHMSKADMRRMHSCMAMSHSRMMRSASCRRMARMHPDMMHHDGMMRHDNMMKSGQ